MGIFFIAGKTKKSGKRVTLHDTTKSKSDMKTLYIICCIIITPVIIRVN